MSLTEGNRLPRMFAVVMSLPRVDVRMQIKKSVQVIRLNAPKFKPANVTRMSRKGAKQSGLATPQTLWELACQRCGRYFQYSSLPDTPLSLASQLPQGFCVCSRFQGKSCLASFAPLAVPQCPQPAAAAALRCEHNNKRGTESLCGQSDSLYCWRWPWRCPAAAKTPNPRSPLQQRHPQRPGTGADLRQQLPALPRQPGRQRTAHR